MLSHWDSGVLAHAFGLDRRQVRADATLLAKASLDDVVATLRERHNWSAMTAYRYLRAINTALRGGPVSL